jgi:hypothetical protein
MSDGKDLLKELKLEDMQKRFQQIVEYTFITSPTISEDGDEDEGNEQEETQSEDNPDVDVSSNTNTVQSEDEPVETEVSDEDEFDTTTTQMQNDDEVIDVDDLTSAQEETEYKVDGVDDKLVRISKVISKLIPAIEANNNKIEDLKAEFEKRNPTEEEKINLRSQSSYPYSVKPKDYWQNKEKDSNYNVMYNNEVSPNEEEKEYILRKSDITNSGMDDRSIYKSFNTSMKMTDFLK